MCDDIPPDVTAYLDDVARHLRGLNGGKRIPVAWTRYLLQALQKHAAKKHGRSHPKRKEITIRLLKADLSGERGALQRAIDEASDAYGVDTRTLENWVQWPPSPDLIEAAAATIAERALMEESRILHATLTAEVDRIETVPHLEDWWRAHRAEIKALIPEDLKALKRHCTARKAAIAESRSNVPP